MKLLQMAIGATAISLLVVAPVVANTNFSDATGTNFSDGTGTNFSDGTGTNFSDGTGTSSQLTRFTENAGLVTEAQDLASEIEACQASNCEQINELVQRAQFVLNQLEN